METMDSASLPSSQEVLMLLDPEHTPSSKRGEGHQRKPRTTVYQLCGLRATGCTSLNPLCIFKRERFSRQEHWSGLPFPSPMHESEK